jgi:hypothetical protein
LETDDGVSCHDDWVYCTMGHRSVAATTVESKTFKGLVEVIMAVISTAYAKESAAHAIIPRLVPTYPRSCVSLLIDMNLVTKGNNAYQLRSTISIRLHTT